MYFNLSRLVVLLEVVFLSFQSSDEHEQFLGFLGQLGHVGVVDVERSNALFEDGALLFLESLLRLLAFLIRLCRNDNSADRTIQTATENVSVRELGIVA